MLFSKLLLGYCFIYLQNNLINYDCTLYSNNYYGMLNYYLVISGATFPDFRLESKRCSTELKKISTEQSLRLRNTI